MKIDEQLRPADLLGPIDRVMELAKQKVLDIDRTWDPANGTPVYTVAGRYTTRGWTEWTQGFQYGSALLVFDATDDRSMYELGRKRTLERMLPHVTHIGVHDHGFNNLSTYGNIRRLIREGRVEDPGMEAEMHSHILRASGAVQAARWAPTADADPLDGGGYVYSFNGPQSLFVDTMRSMRILALADQLGHVLMGEYDERINLLGRAIAHGLTTAKYIVFYGDSGHSYDVRGRTAHEAIFNRNDGRFRCRSTQQGYSPFSTWTRGLAWAVCGYAEQLEYLATLAKGTIRQATGIDDARVIERYEQAALATSDHYIDDCAAADGIVYWDDGAPGLVNLGNWRSRPAEPYNEHEPVDGTASAITAQGLIRLGRYLGGERGTRYVQAGLSIARVLFDEPYLSTSPQHQGLLLHSIYHRPNNWDHIPDGRRIPCGESSLWGDYHLLELAVLIQRLAKEKPYMVFFDS